MEIVSFEGKYAFLSNFYPAKIHIENKEFGFYDEYPTAEHAYQASKAFMVTEKEQIKSASTPGLAKKYGKFIRMRSDWDEVKLETMEEIVRIKFEMNPDLAQLLVDTGDMKLVEGNWWHDTYWGVCNGRGHNHLGKILMKVREELSHLKPLDMEELDDHLCEYCPCTEFGHVKVNTAPWNLCEGCRCDVAYENYLDEFEDRKGS